MTLHHGDCLEVLKGMADCSVDAIVTDPPAGIAFMGKAWDHDKGGRDAWIVWMADVATECLRIIKPGGHALVWSLPRTSHWTATAWENAGWEVRDRLIHVFGSGWPKSRNLAGGLGSALKPAVEDWWLLRRPLIGTIAENVLAHGTGALNIDACRIGTEDDLNGGGYSGGTPTGMFGLGHLQPHEYKQPSGRWPSHLVHDGSEEVTECFPQTGTSTGGRCAAVGMHKMRGDIKPAWAGDPGYGDSGSAARFFACLPPDEEDRRLFYCQKASTADRDRGCERMEARRSDYRSNEPEDGYGGNRLSARLHGSVKARNHHPTVKSTPLMRWLCRLITPPRGLVCDPFMGSGSTGKATVLEGFDFIGIEQDAEYVEIARRRIAAASAQGRLDI